MLRNRLIPAAMFAMAIALAGCTSASAPSWMPSWLTIKPPPPPTVTLQFESAPAGADVRTVDGQTCKTPCSLALPLTAQSVSFGLNGYLPQTVAVEVAQAGEPNFQPNPVEVTLQTPQKPKPHKPKAAATTKPPPPPRAMAAPPQPAQDDSFPPPPQIAAPASPFPPPPQTR